MTRRLAGFRVGRRLLVFSALGVGVAVLIGGVSYAQGGQIEAASAQRAALGLVDRHLAELDRLCSEDQIAERDMLLATTDPARAQAATEAADIRKLADAEWDE